MKNNDKNISVFRIVITLSPLLLFFGFFLWSGVLGFADSFLTIYGFFMFAVGISALVFVGYMRKYEKIVSALIASVAILFILFCTAAMIHIVPGLPYRPIYGMIAAPFIIAGGVITATDTVKVKVQNKNGKFEDRTYEVTTETFGKEKKITKIKRIK